MIVYAEEKKDFISHVRDNKIADIVNQCMVQKLGRKVGTSERRSWQNSLHYMRNILDDDEIPDDVGVAIEYNIPQTGKRIDFILSGYDNDYSSNAVIIELKQWDEIQRTNLDATVKIARFGNVPHPSYQAWSYKMLMEDFNDAVRKNEIGLYPCAYLHNYKEPENDLVLKHEFYEKYLEEAPAFTMNDSEKLRSFIKSFVKFGDKKQILYIIESGKVKPSKSLANSLVGMIQGNDEFTLIDDQKIVYETALSLADEISNPEKQVLIIRGGPGTGKTVVAINLLVELTRREKLVQYVTSNVAPRAVYESKLTGVLTKNSISNLFKGSTGYQNTSANTFDALIVDEAHRLSARNLLNTYKGNQVKDIITAARFSVFFIDESQKVLLEDIGTEAEIIRQAKENNARVTITALPSQFRCNGSDGYIAWLDNTLNIAETANYTLQGIDYDFRVIDSPKELHALIREKNSSKESSMTSGSRIVAGYCWPWNSKKNNNEKDIIIDDYSAQWNKGSDGALWAITENSINEVGCIHTCQGLEFDYIGVIIGNDLVARNGEIVTQPLERNTVDANKTLRGYKGMINSEDASVVNDAKIRADKIIKNTYKVLMTRGQKGCYIYCCDEELSKYFKERIYGLPYNIDESESQKHLMVAEIDDEEYNKYKTK